MRNYLFERALGQGLPVETVKKQRRAKRRSVLSAVLFLVLILGLTGAMVWFRQVEGNVLDHLEEAAGDYDTGDPYFGIYPGLRGDKDGETRIPKAPAGVEPLLLVSEHEGAALTGEEIYKKVLPSIVSVTGYSVDMGSSGSGIVLSADGYIITNYHVIEGMDRASVTPLTTGVTSPAKLVGYDAEMDVAVLKIDRDDLTPAEFGSSRDMIPGQKVYAIGNPMGYLYGTITDGIVSAVNRSVTVGGYSMTLLQTNAALNSGNSGGALVNDWGQVVGITVAKIDPPSEVTTEGLGLAIPVSDARRCVNTLLRLGEMENPVIGITGKSWQGGRGVEVASVNAGGPAEAAGILPGDVILSANSIVVDSVDALKDVIYDMGAGTEMPCIIQRGEKRLEVILTPEKSS